MRFARICEAKFDCALLLRYTANAGWSSLVARRAHNPKVVSSNLTPATNFSCAYRNLDGDQLGRRFCFLGTFGTTRDNKTNPEPFSHLRTPFGILWRFVVHISHVGFP